MDQPFADGEEGSLIDVLENPNAESTDMHITFQRIAIQGNRSLPKYIDRAAERCYSFFLWYRS
jgi:RNA polymerase primary sigma factor